MYGFYLNQKIKKTNGMTLASVDQLYAST